MTKEVEATLRKLHPQPEPVSDDVLCRGTPPTFSPTIFDELNGDSIRKAALRTQGAAGISGGDADHWRRMLFSFGDHSQHLSDALAILARRLCTEYMDPLILGPLLANRLIPLDKCPGTRPVCIGGSPDASYPLILGPLLANCLIPLDKCPGRVR